MNVKQWLNDWRNAAVKKTMPVLSFPCVQLTGVTVRQLVSDSTLQAKGMKAVADRVDSAAAVSMMDLSVEAEAFGCTIRFSDGEVPTVTGQLLETPEDAQALQIPEVGAARTGIYIDAIRQACALITDRPVFAGVIGPFSLAGRLMDVTEALVNCYTEPEMVHAVMEKTVDFLIPYIREYREADAAGIVMAEPLTGMLSPEMAEEFSEPYVRRIIEAVQTDDFAVIYHKCGGNTVQMIDSILRTGAAAYHFCNAISMENMLPHIPSDVIAMGNIDPAGEFAGGTPESIRKATLDLMTACCPKYPNFIISSGCDIPPHAKWENIDAYFKAVADYYHS